MKFNTDMFISDLSWNCDEELMKDDDALTAIIENTFGEEYNAVYLCPTYPAVARQLLNKGSWTFVISSFFDYIAENIYKINPNSRIIEHDIRCLEYPSELVKEGFDLALLNRDNETRGVNYYVANYCLRVGGLAIVHEGYEGKSNSPDNLAWERFLEQHPNYEVVFNPPFCPQTILVKTCQDINSERKYIIENYTELSENKRDNPTKLCFFKH